MEASAERRSKSSSMLPRRSSHQLSDSLRSALAWYNADRLPALPPSSATGSSSLPFEFDRAAFAARLGGYGDGEAAGLFLSMLGVDAADAADAASSSADGAPSVPARSAVVAGAASSAVAATGSSTDDGVASADAAGDCCGLFSAVRTPGILEPKATPVEVMTVGYTAIATGLSRVTSTHTLRLSSTSLKQRDACFHAQNSNIQRKIRNFGVP